MAQPNIYASREGALYQSYDNYAGQQGMYDPYANTGQQVQVQAQDPFAQYYARQGVPQTTQVVTAVQAAPVSGTVMVPIQQVAAQPVVPQVVQMMPWQQQMQQPMQQAGGYVPVQYGSELRGVGIKFGERIDPRTGGLLVYVKRLVQGGPAAASGRVNPGDTLVLINGEDVYGFGLEGLRERIPGPAGTTVRLGFRTQAGQFYEVDLPRTAYGGEGGEQQQQQQQQQPQQMPQQQMQQQYAYGGQVTQVQQPMVFGTQQILKQAPMVMQAPVSVQAPMSVQSQFTSGTVMIPQQQQRIVQYVQPQQQQIQYIQQPQQSYYTSSMPAAVTPQPMAQAYQGGTVQYVTSAAQPQFQYTQTQAPQQVIMSPSSSYTASYSQVQQLQEPSYQQYAVQQAVQQPTQQQGYTQDAQYQQQTSYGYTQTATSQSYSGGYQQTDYQQQQAYMPEQQQQPQIDYGAYQQPQQSQAQQQNYAPIDYGAYQQPQAQQGDWYGQNDQINGTQV